MKNPEIGQQKCLIFWILFLTILVCTLTPSQARMSNKNFKSQSIDKPILIISEKDILKDSQISYRADGGFTGIKSYGVIISCVNGKISTLKSFHDPHRYPGPLRQKGSMDRMTYLKLWDSLKRQQVL